MAADERALFHLINLAREENAYLLFTARTAPATWPVAIPDLISRLRALPVATLAAAGRCDAARGDGQACRRSPAHARRSRGRLSVDPYRALVCRRTRGGHRARQRSVTIAASGYACARGRDISRQQSSSLRHPSVSRNDLAQSARNPACAARSAARRARSCAPVRGPAKRNSLTRSSRTSTLGRDFRQQRHAVAIRHHLHDGRERSGAETGRRVAARRGTERQRLIAQAMSLLEENKPALIDVVDGDAPVRRQRIGGRHAPAETDRRTAAASRCRRRRPA